MMRFTFDPDQPYQLAALHAVTRASVARVSAHHNELPPAPECGPAGKTTAVPSACGPMVLLRSHVQEHQTLSRAAVAPIRRIGQIGPIRPILEQLPAGAWKRGC
jgi:hypothetical protein